MFKKWFIDNPENVDWSAGTFRELIQSTLNGDWGKETPTGNNTEKVYCIRGADIPEVKALCLLGMIREWFAQTSAKQ